MDVLPACTMCIPDTLRGKKLYSCELPCEFQELNPGPLENVCVLKCLLFGNIDPMTENVPGT